mgnify:CR=1 FL=1
MKKKLSYRDKLLELAYIYNVREIQDYVKSKKNLTSGQLELILKKNSIAIPKDYKTSFVKENFIKPIAKFKNNIAFNAYLRKLANVDVNHSVIIDLSEDMTQMKFTFSNENAKGKREHHLLISDGGGNAKSDKGGLVCTASGLAVYPKIRPFFKDGKIQKK